MNRLHHINFIAERLSVLATEIELRGKLNLLDLHLHPETFYVHFFNEIFCWNLQNMNTIEPNATAIDLIDNSNKIIIQVSATATKKKVESALGKNLKSYSNYQFKFISISKDASTLRKNSFINPHNLKFAPANDIYDVPSILRCISSLSIADQGRIASFIKKELVSEVDPIRLESNLASIINILAKEDWTCNDNQTETKPFNIDSKIEHNNIMACREIIDDYVIHHKRVLNIYSEFDAEGNNKSLSVLDSIRKHYVVHSANFSDDSLFFKVIECVAEQVQHGSNFDPIPVEELDLCVNILVVDAFIRCKIFKNPGGYKYAAP
jgi:hypothetical protein